MSTSVWSMFPFPTVSGTDFTDGSLVAVHPDCRTCPSRACISDAHTKPGEVRTCRFGLGYSRVDEDRVVVGLVITDPPLSGRARRRNRLEPERRMSRRVVSGAVEAARKLGPGAVDDFMTNRTLALSRMSSNPDLVKAVAAELRRGFEKNLQQSHDFLQLVNLVQKHAEVMLAEKHPEMSAQAAAELLPIEGSIYFSTQLMALKLDALIYLSEPNLAAGGQTRFQIHPFLLKYVRIYNWRAKEKGLNLSVVGDCHSSVFYNSEALGAVVQGILDNAVKYAPSSSSALVKFEELSDEVVISVSSLGPRIAADEVDQIFLPGYRGVAARDEEDSGQGIGLATARQVSEVLSLDLRVSQDGREDSRFPQRFSTTFSFRVRRG
jgi:signal transduction histidine kinase